MLGYIGSSWGGNDGTWSLFDIQVGTPPQTFSVLPSLNAPMVLVPRSSACSDNADDAPYNCGQLRGTSITNINLDGFDPTQSTSWRQNDVYEIPQAVNITSGNDALFANDILSILGVSDNSISVNDTLIAAYDSNKLDGFPDFWLGSIGLGLSQAFLGNETEAQSNLLTSLKSAGHIESLSFAYTAGASYRPGQPVGHLSFGGYDSMIPDINPDTRLSFPFSSEPNRPFSVVLKTVLASNTTVGDVDVPLLADPIVSVIDTTLPEIWLPQEACDRFQQAFSLIYDEQSGDYFANDTVHEQLRQLNPEITLRFSPNTSTQDAVNIHLPYSAFDLQQGFPFVLEGNQTYFPIKRADSPDQYVIGRTFLQEAYIVADYERRNFTIAQRSFEYDDTVSDMVPIQSLNSLRDAAPEEANPETSRTALPLSAVLGIAIGILVGVLLSCITSVCWFRRRRRQRARMEQQQTLAPYLKDSFYRTPSEADSIPLPVEVYAPPSRTGSEHNELSGNQTPRLPKEQAMSRYAHARQISGLHEIAAKTIGSALSSWRGSRASKDSSHSSMRALSMKVGLPSTPRDVRINDDLEKLSKASNQSFTDSLRILLPSTDEPKNPTGLVSPLSTHITPALGKSSTTEGGEMELVTTRESSLPKHDGTSPTTLKETHEQITSSQVITLQDRHPLHDFMVTKPQPLRLKGDTVMHDENL